MDQKRKQTLALILALSAAMSLAGCSSSEVSENGEVTADELPVVDAGTDQLPDQIDGAAAPDAQLAQNPVPGADGLQPEASVDVPTNGDPTMNPTAATPDAVAAAPTTEPANSPSMDAPPVMNETAAPVATAATPSHGSGNEVYEVKSGDTLMKVAFMVYGDVYQWRKVLDDNADRISDPARLVKGTQLKVDNAPNEDYYAGHERYLVKTGDTLGVIADDVYGTKKKWKDLWHQNEGLVKDPNRIYAGFFLRYTMSDQDRQESERLKSMHQAPLAGADDGDQVRNPSSVPVEQAQAPAAPAPAAAMPTQAQ